MNIRPTIQSDITQLQRVLQSTELFPPDMLPQMIEDFLTDRDSAEIWLSCEEAGNAIGFCYAVPEQLTHGTWNMLAIAIDTSVQSAGFGSRLVQCLESDLRKQGHRLLIADTSGTEAYHRTRAFYRKCGYIEEARIRDFWAKGDDKVTFSKAL